MKNLKAERLKAKRLLDYEVYADYYKWRLTLPLSSRGSRYKAELTGRGVVGGLKHLLRSKSNERQVEKFGFEWLVVDKRFKCLFTAKDIAIAKARIERYYDYQKKKAA
jgi:hypothetical protein